MSDIFDDVGSGAGSIMDWLSGSGLADKGFNNAETQGTNYYNQGLSYFSPYQQMGGQAYGQYNNWAQRMQDPTSFVNNIMSQYQQSPWAQFQQQQGMRAMNQSAAAGGSLGTPSEMRQLARYDQGVNSQDMGNYMNRALNVNQQYGGALNNMNQMGFNAAMSMNQNRMGIGDMLSQLYQNQGMTDMYGRQQGVSSLMQLGSMAAGMF